MYERIKTANRLVLMITEHMLIASDRDITIKAKLANYLDVDIKKGKPFYPRGVSPSWSKEKLVFVPAFAGDMHGFPEDWFYEYDAEYVAMHNSIFHKASEALDSIAEA